LLARLWRNFPMAHSHSHDHLHAHGHHHHHAPTDFGRAFIVGVLLNSTLVGVEAGYGIWSGSLSLIADAGHNFGDVLGLLVAWGAAMLVKRDATSKRTYGFRRSGILASLFNALLLFAAVGGVGVEAVRRLVHPEPLAHPLGVALVAGIGIVINLLAAWGFERGRGGDLNVRGAWLHLMYDALFSFGVVVAALVQSVTHWGLLDPLVALALSFFVARGAWSLGREALDLALDAVPSSVDAGEVAAFLRGQDGVVAVHDLHIWGMSTTQIALTAHLLCPDISDCDHFLHDLTHDLEERFGIGHTTIQLERSHDAHPCHAVDCVPEDVAIATR